jgi:hypothetical protein
MKTFSVKDERNCILIKVFIVRSIFSQLRFQLKRVSAMIKEEERDVKVF